MNIGGISTTLLCNLKVVRQFGGSCSLRTKPILAFDRQEAKIRYLNHPDLAGRDPWNGAALHKGGGQPSEYAKLTSLQAPELAHKTPGGTRI